MADGRPRDHLFDKPVCKCLGVQVGPRSGSNNPVDRFNAWNAAMKSFFSSLKTERIGWRTYRSRDQARRRVRPYPDLLNPRRQHSMLVDLSPVECERRAMEAQLAVHEGCVPGHGVAG